MADSSTLHRDIVNALDIEAEYKALGVEATSRQPSQSGWVACWAVNRPHGNAPSAGFNVQNGYYRDFGGGGEALTFFDFAARYHPSNEFKGDWREARRFYAKKVGMSRRLPKKDQDQRPIDAFSFSRQWNSLLIMGLLKRYPETTEEALRLCGGQQAKYPAKGSEQNYVVALPAFGPDLLDSPPRGYSCLPATSRPIAVFAGEGNPPKLLTKMNKGPSGLIGHHGLVHLRSAELIYKVEGLSDLLAMQAFVPEELRDKHVVITNSSGASEVNLPSEVAPVFAGKDVVIIHDCDRPGQDGAQVWVHAIGNGIAGSVRNLVLPYPIEESKGKDLRDWIGEGHGYSELLAMVERTEPASISPAIAAAVNSATSAASAAVASAAVSNGSPLATAHSPTSPAKPSSNELGLAPHQAILKRMGVIVLGHVQGTDHIVCFSQIKRRVFYIKDIKRFGIETALMHIGQHCETEIQVSGEPDPSKIHISALKRALSMESGKRELTDTNQLGVGIWELSGRLVMIGAGEVVVVNGEVTSSNVPELHGKLLDFGGSDPWFNLEHVSDLYAASADPKWCMDVCDEAIEIFSRWDNWLYDDCPELITALVCCSWIQTVWDYRPSVCVTGGANTGKTMLMEECLQKLFGKQMCIFTSKPTEAGVRQAIGHTAKIVLIDEFEHDRHRQQILNLFRSSTRGTDIIRGTTGHRHQSFHLCHIPWVSAIETGLKSEADRSRYIILDLQSIPKGRPSRLTVPNEEQLRELGNRLMVVAMRNWQVAKHLAMVLKAKSYGEVDRRVVESYSVPCAMLAAVMGMDAERATELLGRVLGKRKFGDDHETDEESLIRDILESQVRLPRGGTMTVSQLLVAKSFDLDDQKVSRTKILERVGIKPIENGSNGDAESNGSLGFEFVFFAPATIQRELLYKSRFQDLEIGQILMRAGGAKKSRQRMGGHWPRGISLPVETLGVKKSEDGVF
jgi:hypothetical protein